MQALVERVVRRGLRAAGYAMVPLAEKPQAYIVHPDATIGRLKERGEGVRAYGLLATAATLRDLDDPRMKRAIDAGLATDPHAMPGQSVLRMYYAIKMYGATRALKGDVVAIGVSYGKAVRSILEFYGPPRDKNLYLVDPWHLANGQDFDGLTFCHNHAALLESFGDLARCVSPVIGFAPDALSATGSGPLSFVHMNVSKLDAELASFHCLYDRVVNGGVILVDAFAWQGLEDNETAWREAAGHYGAEFIPLMTGQGFIVKRSQIK